MSEQIDDISIRWEEDGVEVVKELDKVILSRGAWVTILFKYQDWNAKTEAYGPEKYSIRRYQKRYDKFQPKSKFNISSVAQAKKIVDALNVWIEPHLNEEA